MPTAQLRRVSKYRGRRVRKVPLRPDLVEDTLSEERHSDPHRAEVRVGPPWARERALDVVRRQLEGVAREVRGREVKRRDRRVHIGATGDGGECPLRLIDDVGGVDVAHDDEHEPVRVTELGEVGRQVVELQRAHGLHGSGGAVRVRVPGVHGFSHEEPQATVAVLLLVVQERELPLPHDLELRRGEGGREERLGHDREERVPARRGRLRADRREVGPRVPPRWSRLAPRASGRTAPSRATASRRSSRRRGRCPRYRRCPRPSCGLLRE